MEMRKNLNKIVIVGGGTAGWLSALYCVEKIKTNYNTEIVIIEPSNLPIIGVGEGTVDSFMDFLEKLNIDLVEFLKETKGSIKHGIHFQDWLMLEKEYWHPFYSNSVSTENILKLTVSNSDFNDLFLNTLLAKNDKTAFSHENRVSAGFHFDSTLVCDYLRKICLNRGVKLIDKVVKDVAFDDKNFVDTVICEDGDKVHGDFFIDCTGFKSLIIGKKYKTPFKSFSKYLICDQALTKQSMHDDQNIKAYTISKAQKYGWTWEIPTVNRKGNGYVYSSHFSSDAQVEEDFSKHLGLDLNESEFKKVKFKVGHYEKAFVGNCLAVGLSSGFIEPLEATGLLFVTKSLEVIGEFFKENINETQVNDIIGRYYTTTRDFIFLHYKLTDRTDTEFWKHVQSIEYPESLEKSLVLIRSTLGVQSKDKVDYLKQELFPWDVRAYLFVLNGMDNLSLFKINQNELEAAHKEIVNLNRVEQSKYEDLFKFLVKVNEKV